MAIRRREKAESPTEARPETLPVRLAELLGRVHALDAAACGALRRLAGDRPAEGKGEPDDRPATELDALPIDKLVELLNYGLNRLERAVHELATRLGA